MFFVRNQKACSCYCLHIDRLSRSRLKKALFLLYGRDPRLPTGTELDNASPEYLVDMDDYRTELVVSMAKAKRIALENICQAQHKQKEFYDRHSGEAKYLVGESHGLYAWRCVR